MNRNAFRGELLRGSEWRGADFASKRVALIARGHDAVPILPSVVRSARAVKWFQTEPTWIVPPLRSIATSRWREEIARLYLFASVRDPWKRRLLTPDRRYGAPGVVVSDSFYAALQQPHCKLVPWPVYAIVEHGVRSAEGVEHRFDCIIVPEPTALPVGVESGSAYEEPHAP